MSAARKLPPEYADVDPRMLPIVEALVELLTADLRRRARPIPAPVVPEPTPREPRS